MVYIPKANEKARKKFELKLAFDKIQDRVKFLLEKNSSSRDDDTLLCFLYWMKFDNLTPISSIVGARQRLQRIYPELQASPEAQKRRIGKFECFRELEGVENV